MVYWGGGGKGYVGPPSQIIGGGLAPPWPPLFLRLCHKLNIRSYYKYTRIKQGLEISDLKVKVTLILTSDCNSGPRMCI